MTLRSNMQILDYLLGTNQLTELWEKKKHLITALITGITRNRVRKYLFIFLNKRGFIILSFGT